VQIFWILMNLREQILHKHPNLSLVKASKLQNYHQYINNPPAPQLEYNNNNSNIAFFPKQVGVG